MPLAPFTALGVAALATCLRTGGEGLPPGVRLILFAFAAALVLRRFRLALFGIGWLLLSFAGLVAIYWISTNPVTSHLANSSDRTIDSLVLAGGLLVPVLLAQNGPRGT